MIYIRTKDEGHSAPDNKARWKSGYSFAGEVFFTKASLYERLKEIKDKPPVGREIDGHEGAFLTAALMEANQYYGYPLEVPVRWASAWGEGSNVQFNYWTAESPMCDAPSIRRLSQQKTRCPVARHRQRVQVAFRQAIAPQMYAAKVEYFRVHGSSAVCELTGQRFDFGSADVDHFPVRYSEILTEFLNRSGITDEADVPLEEHIDRSLGGALPRYVLGNGLEEPWQSFHGRLCTLRVISREAHRRRTALSRRLG